MANRQRFNADDVSIYIELTKGITGMAIIEVSLLLRVCGVVLALLLMAGDVERNPGPTGKKDSELANNTYVTKNYDHWCFLLLKLWYLQSSGK